MSDYLRDRLTEDDIVNPAANGRWPHAEPLCAHLLLERDRYPQTLMEKRKQRSFSLVDPKPKSNFEEKLIAEQQSEQDTRYSYLLATLFLIGLVACLAWLAWG
jgi:hypothetical protein